MGERDKIDREWLAQNYPQFSESNSTGFVCGFESKNLLSYAQFVKDLDGTRVFESCRIEIFGSANKIEAIQFYTSGLESRSPGESYDFSQGGPLRQMKNPDFGGPEIVKMSFEDWVRESLDSMIADSERAHSCSTPVTRSLNARKPRKT